MSLKVWLPLDGDLRNLGCSGVEVTNNGATVDNSGKIGKCYYFDGTSNYLLGNPAPLSNDSTEWSFCCWFKPNRSHQGTLFCNRTTADTTGIAIIYYNSTFIIDDGGRWEPSSSAVQINQWNHIAVTVQRNKKICLYLNGLLINSTTTTHTPTIANATHFTIGGSQGSNTSAAGNWFDGYLNDVRIYDHALSAAEVREIAQGLVLHYKLDDITNGVVDSSGYGHNGTITGILTTSNDSPRYNISTYFDGSSYVSTAAGAMSWYQMDQGTFACWMKPTADMSGWRGSWGIAEDGTYTKKGWAITDYANTFRVTYINGSTYVTVSSEKALPQNEWHHCAATLDGTTVKMYFDGELVKTETINWGTATIPTAARMELGVNFPRTDEKFTGCYSDARFYVTPLLDTDIKMLYNVSMKINNLGGIHTFKFEEATNEKLFKTGILQTNELEETSIQLARLQKDKGWLSTEFIEI